MLRLCLLSIELHAARAGVLGVVRGTELLGLHAATELGAARDAACTDGVWDLLGAREGANLDAAAALCLLLAAGHRLLAGVGADTTAELAAVFLLRSAAE